MKLILFSIILAFSSTSWATKIITCDSNLMIVDRSQPYGVTSEKASSLAFSDGQYKLYVSFEVGNPSDASTWASQGMIAPEEVDVGNTEA